MAQSISLTLSNLMRLVRARIDLQGRCALWRDRDRYGRHRAKDASRLASVVAIGPETVAPDSMWSSGEDEEAGRPEVEEAGRPGGWR